MTFIYRRTIRFQDTDAAGVVYFANTLAMCHEAYEEALMANGIDLGQLMSASNDLALPIVHASVDYYQPAYCGDRHEIHLSTTVKSDSEFELHYEIYRVNDLAQPISQAQTRHVCINPSSRQRRPLPLSITDWLHHC